MWNLVKYFNLAIRLETLWSGLKKNNAHAPETTIEHYEEQADAFFTHEAWQKYENTKLNESVRAKMQDPEVREAFIMGMDFITE